MERKTVRRSRGGGCIHALQRRTCRAGWRVEQRTITRIVQCDEKCGDTPHFSYKYPKWWLSGLEKYYIIGTLSYCPRLWAADFKKMKGEHHHYDC